MGLNESLIAHRKTDSNVEKVGCEGRTLGHLWAETKVAEGAAASRESRECNPCPPARVYPGMEVILLVLGGIGVITSIGCAIWLLDKRERMAQQHRHESAEVERALSERIGPPPGSP